ncbi:hypothetical protein CYMTET_7337 [Cymbomonas tetramitiformis]|nr:hypothetical protein CYMTET_7337 [Cymbomonas tetramitiformis]
MLNLVTAEYERFRKTKIFDKSSTANFNLLGWWADLDGGGQYPNLRLLARIIYSIPGSEIENERIFSIAGCIASIKRSTMLAENLHMLAHINQNLPDDPLENLYVPEDKMSAFTDSFVSSFDLDTYEGFTAYDEALGAQHEEALIENEFVDESMAEIFPPGE